MSQNSNWYNCDLYLSIADIDGSWNQRQCIAPTVKGRRCPYEISEDEMIKTTSLRRDAEILVDGAIRDELIRQYAILRCCEEATHREKLEYAPECLGALVARYGSMIPRGTQISNAEHSQRQSQRSQTKQGRSSKRAVVGGSSGGGGGIRSRSSPLIPWTNPVTGEVFITYKTVTPDTVRSVILSDIPPPSAEQHSPRRGEVYCFTQAVTPDYVKIGHTGKRAAKRLTDQKKCFPEAVLQCHCEFAFPERMERLVHLQMAQQRRKLVRCRLCGHGHQEFFEVSVTHAAGVIHDWARVVQREPLYDDSTDTLTAAWRNRIANIKGDITAKKLLKAHAEEMKKRKAQSYEEAAACKIQLSSTLSPPPPPPSSLSSPSSLLPNFKIIPGTTTASTYRHRILLDDDKDCILAYFEDVIRSLFLTVSR